MAPTRMLAGVFQRVQRFFGAVRAFCKESPVVVAVVLVVLVVLSLVAFTFHTCFSKACGGRIAVVMDLACLWLLLRLIARSIVFPGSVILLKRNTEASYRVEMSKQYWFHLRNLEMFLRCATKRPGASLRGVTPEGVLTGCAVIERLGQSYELQIDNKVRLTRAQAEVHSLAERAQRYLKAARVRGGSASTEGESNIVSFMEWLRSAGALRSGASGLLHGVEFADEAAATAELLEGVGALVDIFDDARAPRQGWCRNAARFIRVPVVGSLHQLRSELQMRHAGQHFWVKSGGGRQIDAMFIPCDRAGAEDRETAGEHASEKIPLKGRDEPLEMSGPTIVWCNPNAGYYETMVYQTGFLEFYLDRGCNVVLWNYSGFGRSTGTPSPARIAEDADSVVFHLQERGITEIGVHGRSIGGIPACHLAKRHPGVVRFLVADRTFSTLAATAKCTYGDWAVKGLNLAGTWADNTANFLDVRCHKVMVCDPKDHMIPDLSALRTAVAREAVQRLPAGEAFAISDEQLQKVADAWQFFTALFVACEESDDVPDRQPLKDEPLADDVRLKVGISGSGVGEGVDVRWVQDHGATCRAAMNPFVDQIRSALYMVCEQLDAGGLSLDDAIVEAGDDLRSALRSLLASIQVWGSLGDHSGNAECINPGGEAGSREREIEHFLRKGDRFVSSEVSPERMAELEEELTPDQIAVYHRQLARARIAAIRKELRRRLASLQHSFASNGDGQSPHHSTSLGAPQHGASTQQTARLHSTVLHHLSEVEGFVSGLARFFKTVDLSLGQAEQKFGDAAAGDTQPAMESDSSDEKADLLANNSGDPLTLLNRLHPGAGHVVPQPQIDRGLAGYVMHIDCGHNGAMDEVDLRHLGLHLKAAKFGKVFGAQS